MKALQVFTTFAKRIDADRVARALVEKHLVACAQVFGPLTSMYRWKGKVAKAKEWLCILKTTAKAYPELERELRERHPYETPEIIAIPVTRGSRDYLGWLEKEVQGKTKNTQ